jgi:hypothetical protein
MSGAWQLHRNAALRTGRSRPPKPEPVTTIRVNGAVMAAALRLAGGDARRIEIRSETAVVVRNQPRGA